MVRDLLTHPDFATRDTARRFVASPVAVRRCRPTSSRNGKVVGPRSPGYRLRAHGDERRDLPSAAQKYLLSKPSSVGPVLPTFDAKLINDGGEDSKQGRRRSASFCAARPRP